MWATARWLHVITPMYETLHPCFFKFFSLAWYTLYDLMKTLLFCQCKIEWFHFGCVGLKEQPKGKWYCSECTVVKHRRKGRWLRNVYIFFPVTVSFALWSWCEILCSSLIYVLNSLLYCNSYYTLRILDVIWIDLPEFVLLSDLLTLPLFCSFDILFVIG